MNKFWMTFSKEMQIHGECGKFRTGQLMWIALSKIDTPFASKITVHHNNVDPFYDDAKIPVFIEFISKYLGE